MNAKIVCVTDFGTIAVPERVRQRYLEVYYRRRAPKKSKRIAMEVLHSDVAAMMHYAWLMGETVPKW